METEVFLVMPNRSDGDFPKVEKAIGMEMHWLKEDAQKQLDQLVQDVGPYYGIYAAIIKVERRL